MSRQPEQARHLIQTLSKTAVQAKPVEQTEDRRHKITALRQHIDLTPFKQAHAYPGKSYVLVGNSYYVDAKGATKSFNEKRANQIAKLLKGKTDDHHCLSVNDALANDNFTQVLSRFERDWLSRLDDKSMIGPAFDDQGNTVKDAFAVWRLEPALKELPKMATASAKKS